MSETIREYLVGLGFHVDDAGLRKFNSAILNSAAPVVKLGAAVIATSAAIELMVEKVARQMEELYYSSQRAAVLAGTLQAVSFAAKQVGLNAGQGAELVEGLARSMRMSPGVASVIVSLGGQLQDVNGKLGITDEGLKNLLRNLAQMPRYQALSYAGVLGLDPEALNQILNNLPAFIKGMDDAAESAKKFGINMPEVAKDSAEFSRHLNSAEQNLGNLVTRIAHDWMPQAQGFLDTVSGLTVKFGEWNDKMSGTPGKITSVVAALGGIAGVLAFFAKGRAALGALGALGARALPGGAFLYTMRPSSTNEGEDEYIKAHPEIYGPRDQSADEPLGIRKNNPGNLQPGGKEASYSSPEDGLKAMANLLYSYSARGFDTIHKIVSRYAPASAGNDTASYEADLANRMHMMSGEKINFSDPAVVERLMSAMITHEQGKNPYSHEMMSSAVTGRNVTVSQKNEINITGVSDPAAAGRRAGEEVRRANGDLVRNLGGTLQ